MTSGSTTIYILDDESSVRVAMARLMRSAGYVSVMLADMDELLNLEALSEPACIVADVRMPGASGLSLPGLLARRGLKVPVIFVSAQDTEETRAQARRVGAAQFFRKPVDDQALLDAIAWALERVDNNHNGENHYVS